MAAVTGQDGDTIHQQQPPLSALYTRRARHGSDRCTNVNPGNPRRCACGAPHGTSRNTVVVREAGLKESNAWIVVVALAGHGVFDAVHGHVIENAGVPAWWPAWCFSYDVGAAGCLAWLITRRRVTATPGVV